MQKIWMLILSFVVMLAVVGSVSAGRDEGLKCRARLAGDQEVPPVATETTGRFRLQFSGDESAANFELRVNDGERLTQAHIHCAPAGQNGPIVAFLAGLHDRGWDVNGRWVRATLTDANIIGVNPPTDARCPNAITDLHDLAQAGRDGNLYANVHSRAFPGGVVRGQLECDDDDD